MTHHKSVSSVVLFAAGWLVLAAPGLAHKSDEFHLHIDPLIFEVLDVDVDTASSKFNEYRDIQSGLSIPELHLFGDAPDGSKTVDLRAEHVMRDDARYTLTYDSWGEWGLLLDYNKIKHDFGNDGTLMWDYTHPGVFELPDPTQQYFQNQIATGGTSFAFLNNLLQPFLTTANKVDLGLIRDRTEARVDVHKMHKVGVSVDVQHENRNGIRPYAGSFGFSNSIELYEPIDYETTHATATAEYKGDQGGLRLGYRNSTFDNDQSTLVWDNWMRATDIVGNPAHGRADLAADNDSDFLFLQGRFNFGRGWRVSGDLGYNEMTQDDPLVPYTINTAIVGIRHDTGATFNPTLASNLPVDSANAKADVLNFDANLSKEFLKNLTLKLLYRYYDYNNKTPRTVFDGSVVFDSTFTAEPRITAPFAYTRDDLGAELTWDVLKNTDVGISYHRKGVERELREVDSSDEDLYKLSVDTRPSELFQIRGSYEFGDRSSDGYSTLAGQQPTFLEPTEINNIPGLRKYDEAARQFEDWEASVYIYLTDAWNVTLGISGRNDDYDKSQFGLIKDDLLQYSGDISYSPGETWSFYLFGHLADRTSFQRDRQSNTSAPSTDPRDDWSVNLDESTDTAGLGFNGSPNDRWKWNVDVNWSKSDGDADFASPPGGTGTSGSSRDPVDIGNYEDIELFEGELTIDYSINARMAVGLLYRYEDYTLDSFNLQGLMPYLPSTLLLVANDGDYQADVWGIRFKLSL